MQQFDIKISRSRITFILSILILHICLDLSYYFVIAPNFSYAGFNLNPDLLKFIESVFLTVLIAAILPWRIKKPSDFLINLLFMFPVLPTLSFYWLGSAERVYTYMLVVSFIIISIIIRIVPIVKLSRLKGGKRIGLAVSFIGVVVVLVFLLYRGGLRFFNLSILNVYSFRREVGAVINVGLFSYINTWAFKVLNPALISWSLYQRRYGLFVLFTGLQVIFFGISSHKSVLFYPLVIIAVFILMRRFEKVHIFPLALSGAIAVTALIALIFKQMLPASLLIRRVLFVPAQLNYAYYDFFSSKGFVYMSNSILSSFIDYPFAYPPPQMISLHLQGHINTWMNNGFLATSYMHFGFWGMIIFSFIVGFLLAIVDSLSKDRLPLWFSISLVVVPFFSLFTSADLTTALLTHGLGLSLLILWLFSARFTLAEGRDELSAQQG